MIFRPLEGMPLVWRIALALMIVALAVILLLILTWAINGEAAGQTVVAPPPGAKSTDTLLLIKLHGPDGQVIYINPMAVVSVRAPRKGDTLGPELKCLLHTMDGKFIAVTEGCDKFVQEAEGGR